MGSKQFIQAAVLIALVLFGTLYSYIEFFVAPINHEREALLVKMNMAKTQIATGGEELHKILNEEQTELKNEALDHLLGRLIRTVPETPQVDCPWILSKGLLRHGITRSKVTVSGYYPIRGIKGGLLQNWSFSCLDVKPFVLGEAIADLENQLPMAQITDLQIGRNPGETAIRADCTFQFATFR